jgi:lipopolysaccharide transport system permease protein
MAAVDKPLVQTIITPRKTWTLLNWRELREYRDLVYYFVVRDVQVLYRQTVLGFAWAVIRPLVSMVIFSFVFGKLAKVPSDGLPYPIFSYAALVPWTFFSTGLTEATGSLIKRGDMLSKVYFPRILIPLAPILSKLVDFAISFAMLLAMMAWFRIAPNSNAVALPLLILLMVMTSAGIGLGLSALAVQYRDVQHAMTFAIQLLMYAAPVVFPVSLIPEKYRLLYALYPMVGVIEGFRSALLGSSPMPWDLIGVGAASAFAMLCAGLLYFNRAESSFADVA